MASRWTVGQTLDWIRSQLGVGETPPGSNCNRYSAALHRPCEAWCADFATDALIRAGIRELRGSPAAAVLAQQCKDAHLWSPTPAPGYLAFFVWPGDTVIHHVSFVESVRSVHPLEIVDIGGNTGDRVMRSVRRSCIVGYGVVPYAHAHPASGHDSPGELPGWYRRELADNHKPPRGYLNGADVAHVQRTVGATPDGYYGPKTAARVTAWQRAHHVAPVDGIVGPITARAMG